MPNGPRMRVVREKPISCCEYSGCARGRKEIALGDTTRGLKPLSGKLVGGVRVARPDEVGRSLSAVWSGWMHGKLLKKNELPSSRSLATRALLPRKRSSSRSDRRSIHLDRTLWPGWR